MLETLKWAGTCAVIASALARGLGLNDIDIGLSVVGCGLWMTAAIMMKEKALMVVNAFVLIMICGGLLLR
jgi:hydrogenase/urease accessory protein HupE